jgi:hypothetical protein
MPMMQAHIPIFLQRIVSAMMKKWSSGGRIGKLMRVFFAILFAIFVGSSFTSHFSSPVSRKSNPTPEDEADNVSTINIICLGTEGGANGVWEI